MPHETLFKAATAISLQKRKSFFSALFVRLHGFKHGFVKWLKGPSAFGLDKLSCCNGPLLPSSSHQFNPDNKVVFHNGERVGRERVRWVISGYRPRVQSPWSVNTDLTFCTKPRDPPWVLSASRQHLLLQDLQPLGGKRRWKRRGRGGTVQQLFTVVLSSYFMRKHCHSLLNSSSWPVSNSVCDTFQHSDVYCTLCPPLSLCECKSARPSTKCRSTHQ